MMRTLWISCLSSTTTAISKTYVSEFEPGLCAEHSPAFCVFDLQQPIRQKSGKLTVFDREHSWCENSEMDGAKYTYFACNRGLMLL